MIPTLSRSTQTQISNEWRVCFDRPTPPPPRTALLTLQSIDQATHCNGTASVVSLRSPTLSPAAGHTHAVWWSPHIQCSHHRVYLGTSRTGAIASSYAMSRILLLSSYRTVRTVNFIEMSIWWPWPAEGRCLLIRSVS